MARNAATTYSAVRRNPNSNFGRLVDFLPGMSGLTPQGGIPLVNFDCDRRFHRILINCSAVNYTGSGTTPVNLTKIKSTSGTGTPTGYLTGIVNGMPSGITISTGGTGTWVAGDTLSIADATGAGLIVTVATVTGGNAIATATVSGGTPTAINPALLIGAIQLTVNGSPLVDTTAAYELLRAQFNFDTISLGQLPIFLRSHGAILPSGRKSRLGTWPGKKLSR